MVTNNLSKISGVLHRLKYVYPQHVLVAIYKSLFISHLNYGSLLWGHNFDTVSKLQKKVVRTITNSAYIAHSEPILKGLNLLKVQDLHELKKIKFLYKLYANDLPIYFDVYRPQLKKIETHQLGTRYEGQLMSDGGAYSPFRSIILVFTHDFIIIYVYGPTGSDGHEWMVPTRTLVAHHFWPFEAKEVLYAWGPVQPANGPPTRTTSG